MIYLGNKSGNTWIKLTCELFLGWGEQPAGDRDYHPAARGHPQVVSLILIIEPDFGQIRIKGSVPQTK